MPELDFALACQIAASIATLFSMWLMGNKSVKGPLVGALTQIFWFAMVISNELWGLLPFTIIVTLIHLRNLIKWRREDRDQRANNRHGAV